MKTFIKLTANYKDAKEHNEVLLPVDEIVRVEAVKSIGSIVVVKDEYKIGKVYYFPVSDSIDEIEKKVKASQWWKA